MEKIRVFLIGNHVRYREGMSRLLSGEDTTEVIGEAEESEETISQLKTLEPDVVILIPELPSATGFNVVRQIRRHSPRVLTIILGAYYDDEQLFLAIKAGAAAYLTKDVNPEELINAIRRASRGEYPINETLLSRPKIASRVLRLFQSLSLLGEEVEPLLSPLSNRELEILDYIAHGNANKQIALALGISNQTVKNHVTSIMRKLAANDRTHAVVLALRHDLIRMD